MYDAAPMADNDVLYQGLRKMCMALQGMRRNPVVIGALAQQAWGVAAEAVGVDLLIPAGEEHRQSIFGAARGEGIQQATETPILTRDKTATLRFKYREAGGEVGIDLLEASTPYLAQVHKRASERGVMKLPLPTATVEDLILMRALSGLAADHAAMVALLRHHAGRMDAPYVKKEAEAAGVMDKVKAAWGEARSG